MDLRNVPPEEFPQPALVLRHILHRLIQPLLPLRGIGRHQSRRAKYVVQPGLGNGHFLLQPEAQIVVGQHNRGQAQAPQVKPFAGRIADHGPAEHLLPQETEGGVRILPGYKVAVNFIHQHKHAVPQTDLRQALQLLPAPDPPGGIVGAGKNQGLCARSPALQVLIVQGIPPVFPYHGRLLQHPAAPIGQVKEGLIVGDRDKHLVPRLRQGAQDDIHGIDYPRRREAEMLLIHGKTVPPLQPPHNRVIVGLLPGRVAIDRVGRPLLNRLHNTGRAGKVHVRYPHGNEIVQTEKIVPGIPLIGRCPPAVNGGVKVIFHTALPADKLFSPLIMIYLQRFVNMRNSSRFSADKDCFFSENLLK